MTDDHEEGSPLDRFVTPRSKLFVNKHTIKTFYRISGTRIDKEIYQTLNEIIESVLWESIEQAQDRKEKTILKQRQTKYATVKGDDIVQAIRNVIREAISPVPLEVEDSDLQRETTPDHEQDITGT